MKFPKRKWSEESAGPAYTGNEAQLQTQLDDMLSALGIWFLRFPDGFFRWMKMCAPPGIQRFFFGVFGGIPDTLPMIRISDKYMLCCPIELKSAKGRLHGKQKHWEGRGIAVQISRSPEETIAIVTQFQKDAEKMGGI
jgi:hypothetical protein